MHSSPEAYKPERYESVKEVVQLSEENQMSTMTQHGRFFIPTLGHRFPTLRILQFTNTSGMGQGCFPLSSLKAYTGLESLKEHSRGLPKLRFQLLCSNPCICKAMILRLHHIMFQQYQQCSAPCVQGMLSTP